MAFEFGVQGAAGGPSGGGKGAVGRDQGGTGQKGGKGVSPKSEDGT